MCFCFHTMAIKSYVTYVQTLPLLFGTITSGMVRSITLTGSNIPYYIAFCLILLLRQDIIHM